MKKLSGGCSCGAVRFAINDYLYVLMCHCDACKKRTGSAYGLSVMTDTQAELVGETKTYTRSGESGKPVHYEFCPQCGTTVRWKVAIVPNRQVFALGAFDEPDQFKVAGEMYAKEALQWARLGCNLVRPGAPDDPFRSALIEKSKELR